MSKIPSKVSSRNNANNTILFLGEKYDVHKRVSRMGGEHYKVELEGHELISWNINSKYVPNSKNSSVSIEIISDRNVCIVRAKDINLLKETVTQIINSIEYYYRNFIAKSSANYCLEKSVYNNQTTHSYKIIVNDSCYEDTLFGLFGSVCKSVEFTARNTLLITYDSNNETLVNLRVAKLINDGCIAECNKRGNKSKSTASYAGKVTFRGEEKIIVSGSYLEEQIYSITIYILLTDSQVDQIKKIFNSHYESTHVAVIADKAKLFIFAYNVDDIKKNIALIESEIDNIICSDLHHEYTSTPIPVSKLNDATRCGCKFLKQDTTNNNKSPTTYFNIKFDKEYCKTKLQGGTRKNKTKNTLKRRQTKKQVKHKLKQLIK